MDIASYAQDTFLGFDLGTTNLGVVVMASNFTLLWAGTVSLGGVDVQWDDYALAVTFGRVIKEALGQYFVPTYVAVEQNIHYRWQGVLEGIILGYFTALGSKVWHVHPATVKASFEGLGRHGHEQNKHDALELVHSWGYSDIATNHEADAVLCVCALMNKLEDGDNPWDLENKIASKKSAKKRFSKKKTQKDVKKTKVSKNNKKEK